MLKYLFIFIIMIFTSPNCLAVYNSNISANAAINNPSRNQKPTHHNPHNYPAVTTVRTPVDNPAHTTIDHPDNYPTNYPANIAENSPTETSSGHIGTTGTIKKRNTPHRITNINAP